MPLVAHSNLPAFDRLREEGQVVLGFEDSRHQDIREIHVGLLNMMPDTALQATERQFLRLVGACNRIVQLCVHPFTVAPENRSEETQRYLRTYYEDFADLQRQGLDALIITGANPAQADMTREDFWEPMLEVVEWARGNVCSIVCSCFATHAMLQHFHGVERRRMPRKRWGVYSHRVVDPTHPLVRHVNSRFDAPRSHFYEVTSEEVRAAGARVLAESKEAGLQLATSADGLRFVYFQGHPEYDVDSLLKEYKREVVRFVRGERGHFPRYPEHYLPTPAIKILDDHAKHVLEAVAAGREASPVPEAAVRPYLDNTWTDTGKALFNYWLGLVYRLTDLDRKRPFRPGVHPEDPLGLGS